MKPVVLFLCTGNSARSQMAEAILRHEAGDSLDVYSAGTQPKGINPFTIQVMSEAGIDISSHKSTDVKEYLGRLPVRYLIIVCGEADKECPTTWPGVMKRYFWPFEDAAAVTGDDEKKAQFFRLIRDQIWDKVKTWLDDEGIKRRA
jgi:arsenate reductase (thioredoxin)